MTFERSCAEIAADLGVSVTEAGAVGGSMSGSRLYAVTGPDRTRAMLKVTVATRGPARDAAERELRFYLHLRDDVSINTPELLDHIVVGDAIGLLLTAHPAPQPAVDWSRAQWLDLADDLARLHQTPVPHGRGWRHPSWLAEALHHPDVTTAQAFWSRSGEPELLAPVFANIAALRDALSQITDCLVHGDCHTDNILIDHGRLVWIDWQGVGAGNPAAELAFPSVRATPAGAALPQLDMVRHYAEVRGLDALQLSRATLAAELATFLFAWPEYAVHNTPVGIDRVHDRVRTLARAWLEG